MWLSPFCFIYAIKRTATGARWNFRYEKRWQPKCRWKLLLPSRLRVKNQTDFSLCDSLVLICSKHDSNDHVILLGSVAVVMCFWVTYNYGVVDCLVFNIDLFVFDTCIPVLQCLVCLFNWNLKNIYINVSNKHYILTLCIWCMLFCTNVFISPKKKH